eukprot:Plantae.Rhodophyta-Purpureofilum_apyrenoidigerum.ctg577.p1 GENE.Plantae.Rhodophyta-Purpureofilum_apyrenoidigerum.ctg577~~Plantae.Rhodophyta-Purpureofilum_apyrenoidigerum.ctg577.p1  ORF type:complete len:133 (+),score=3.25 Plantae.Rhodophyta-Purpureofilum_apyrenoidigerum.ctg577:431-829(+)
MVVQGWSITIFSATIVLSLKENNPSNLLVTFFITPVFWTIHTNHRKVQQLFISRYNKIEWFLRNPRHLKNAWKKLSFEKLNSPDLTARHSAKDLDVKINFWRIAKSLNVTILYLGQIFILIVIALIWYLLGL